MLPFFLIKPVLPGFFLINPVLPGFHTYHQNYIALGVYKCFDKTPFNRS
jgi:hypothetical protein